MNIKKTYVKINVQMCHQIKCGLDLNQSFQHGLLCFSAILIKIYLNFRYFFLLILTAFFLFFLDPLVSHFFCGVTVGNFASMLPMLLVILLFLGLLSRATALLWVELWSARFEKREILSVLCLPIRSNYRMSSPDCDCLASPASFFCACPFFLCCLSW